MLESRERARTAVRNRCLLPAGGIGTGAPPPAVQRAPSRLWGMPPGCDVGACPRTERQCDVPFGTNHTSGDVARRLSFSDEESHSQSFGPCDRERGPLRSSFLSSTHTGDAPEGLRLELEDEEVPREISRTMPLPRDEERGPIAPLSRQVDERARQRPRKEYRIPVQHRQASSDSCSGNSGEYPPSRPGRQSPHSRSDWSGHERHRERPRSTRRSDNGSPHRGEQ